MPARVTAKGRELAGYAERIMRGRPDIFGSQRYAPLLDLEVPAD